MGSRELYFTQFEAKKQFMYTYIIMVQIKRIGIKQTVKVVAVFYFVTTFIIFVPVYLIIFFLSSGEIESTQRFGGAIFGGVFIFMLPIFYAVMGAVMVAITAAIYNLIAKKVGGVEIELETEPDTTNKPVNNKQTPPQPAPPSTQSRPPMPL